MQPTGSLIYLYTKISSIISWFKSDLTEFSWCPADRQQKWNSEIKPAALAERPGPSLTAPPENAGLKMADKNPSAFFSVDVACLTQWGENKEAAQQA